MRKLAIVLLLIFIIYGYCLAQSENSITIEITNIVINGGTVYIGIFSSADSFRKEEPEFLFELEAVNTIMSQNLYLPNGEYVITAMQDANYNKKLDSGLFGIPRELIGISNYNGRGFPSRNFDRQKILVDRTTGKIIIVLYSF
jgi:uncharacterized protein (DUF2141 family)